jgi:hypothetical protein
VLLAAASGARYLSACAAYHGGTEEPALLFDYASKFGRACDLILVRLADMMLSIELEAETGDEFELGFEEINVLFLVAH